MPCTTQSGECARVLLLTCCHIFCSSDGEQFNGEGARVGSEMDPVMVEDYIASGITSRYGPNCAFTSPGQTHENATECRCAPSLLAPSLLQPISAEPKSLRGATEIGSATSLRGEQVLPRGGATTF